MADGGSDASQPKSRPEFSFVPREDITPYELAVIVSMIGVQGNMEGMQKLSPQVRRHFIFNPDMPGHSTG